MLTVETTNPQLEVAGEAIRAAASHAGAPVISAPALLAAMCDSVDFRFLVDGEPAPAIAVLSDEVLFPAVAWVAHENGRELMQADLGYRFAADPAAALGVRVEGPPVTCHTADLYRALFLLDACTTLFGVRRQADIEITTVAPQLREHLFARLLAAPSRGHQRNEPAASTVAPQGGR